MGKPRRKKKLPPVVWSYENGQHIVTRAAGKYAQKMPAVRLHGLGETIREMGGIVDAFVIAGGLPDDRSQKIMMRLTARVAIDLMQDAAEDWRARTRLVADAPRDRREGPRKHEEARS